jgi:hypothetical protein
MAQCRDAAIQHGHASFSTFKKILKYCCNYLAGKSFLC